MFAWELTHPVIQTELERQLEDIELIIDDTGDLPSLVNRLRT
jgi:hypothetical protein